MDITTSASNSNMNITPNVTGIHVIRCGGNLACKNGRQASRRDEEGRSTNINVGWGSVAAEITLEDIGVNEHS